MTVFILTGFGLYFLFLLLLWFGWEKAISLRTPDNPTCQQFSIIVPMRNEEHNIRTLIESMRHLNYPSGFFEVILVDDHSTDRTVERVTAIISDLPNFKIIFMPGSLQGKKWAITLGVENSSGEVIATTDADCTVPPGWLNLLNLSFSGEEIKMVIGPVSFAATGFFSRLQALEFSSLVSSAGATLALGFPTMANGANLAFRKKTFTDVNGYEGSFHVASGDDETLLRKVFAQFTGSVKFLNDPSGVVMTMPRPSLKSFIEQRLRWAGKWKWNPDPKTRLLAVFVWVVQIFFVGCFFLLFYNDATDLLVILLFSKAALNGIFLWRINSFLQLSFRFLPFVILEVIYPIYVVSIGTFSLFSDYTWKGRRDR